MPVSLSSKLRDLRRTLRPKFKALLLFDDDHLKLLAHSMPSTKEELSRLIPACFVSAYGDQILDVTVGHGRDQSAYEECVCEIRAFVRGGTPGMAVLNRVYTQILKHYQMEDDEEEVFEACKVYLHPVQNRLKRKRVEEDEEPFPGCSQPC